MAISGFNLSDDEIRYLNLLSPEHAEAYRNQMKVWSLRARARKLLEAAGKFPGEPPFEGVLEDKLPKIKAYVEPLVADLEMLAQRATQEMNDIRGKLLSEEAVSAEIMAIRKRGRAVRRAADLVL